MIKTKVTFILHFMINISARCAAGFVIASSNQLQCRICEFGTFQPRSEPIFDECQPCASGETTRRQGATSSIECERK